MFAPRWKCFHLWCKYCNRSGNVSTSGENISTKVEMFPPQVQMFQPRLKLFLLQLQTFPPWWKCFHHRFKYFNQGCNYFHRRCKHLHLWWKCFMSEVEIIYNTWHLWPTVVIHQFYRYFHNHLSSTQGTCSQIQTPSRRHTIPTCEDV